MEQQLYFSNIVGNFLLVTLVWKLADFILGEWRPLTESGKKNKKYENLRIRKSLNFYSIRGWSKKFEKLRNQFFFYFYSIRGWSKKLQNLRNFGFLNFYSIRE